MKLYEKKSKTIVIIAVVVIALFLAGGIALLSRGGSAPQPAPQSADSMHGGAASPSGGNTLIGQPAPPFSLQDRNGTTYTNDSLKGKDVVLFFNEGIMCYPACWNQMMSFAQDSRFNNSSTVALSVVTNQPSDWQSAFQKMPELGSATILFDPTKSVSQNFGMLTMNSSMHYGSYPGHTFVVIDRQGIVRWVFDDPNMGIDNDRIAGELAQMH